MINIEVKPGDVVVTQIGPYQHYSIVSDRICSLGKNMLISATKRMGTVQEEPWDVVTEGKKTHTIVLNTDKSVPEILAEARSQIGKWSYSLTQRNCEHFVKWSSGLKVSSTQVKGGFVGMAVGGVGVAALSENPKALKILAGMVIVGGLAVMASKAIEKKEKA